MVLSLYVVLGLRLRGSHPLRVRGGGGQQRLRRAGHLHAGGELQDGGRGVLQVPAAANQ